MARTNKKVGYSPTGKLEDVTPDMAASGIETAFRMLEGRGPPITGAAGNDDRSRADLLTV
jgi:hypothetical protein